MAYDKNLLERLATVDTILSDGDQTLWPIIEIHARGRFSFIEDISMRTGIEQETLMREIGDAARVTKDVIWHHAPFTRSKTLLQWGLDQGIVQDHSGAMQLLDVLLLPQDDLSPQELENLDRVIDGYNKVAVAPLHAALATELEAINTVDHDMEPFNGIPEMLRALSHPDLDIQHRVLFSGQIAALAADFVGRFEFEPYFTGLFTKGNAPSEERDYGLDEHEEYYPGRTHMVWNRTHAAKKSSAGLESVLAHLGVADPTRVLVFGDHPREDVEFPQQIGALGGHITWGRDTMWPLVKALAPYCWYQESQVKAAEELAASGTFAPDLTLEHPLELIEALSLSRGLDPDVILRESAHGAYERGGMECRIEY